MIERLLIFNLAMDRADPLLSFAVGWVEELARRVKTVDVITMRAGDGSWPSNVTVHSLGKEDGYSEPRRAVRYYNALNRVFAQGKIDACFSHMNPLFTVMGLPLLRARRVPIVTWFAHPSLTWLLRVADRASAKVVTCFPGSYPIVSEKVQYIGQGIDTDLFKPEPVESGEILTIMAVGRISRIKDLTTLLKAADRLRRLSAAPFRVVLVGSPATPADVVYAASLRRMVGELGLSDLVEFRPSVRREALARQYAEAAVLVNLAPPGSADKVALEAMACGVPAMVGNAGFQAILGNYAERLIFKLGDAEDLVRKLSALLARDAGERRRMGVDLRKVIETDHSLTGVADRLVEVFEGVSQNGRRSASSGARGREP